jgi:hypothetical protein
MLMSLMSMSSWVSIPCRVVLRHGGRRGLNGKVDARAQSGHQPASARLSTAWGKFLFCTFLREEEARARSGVYRFVL